MNFITIFHKFNRFLGTYSGELLKRSLELLFIIFACYMVASEWLRTKTNDLKYLLIGFSSLAIAKLISVFFLAQHVFAGLVLRPYLDYISITENFLEISALVLISSAFLYPVHKKHSISLRKKTYVELIAIFSVFAFAALVALNILPFPFGTRRKVILTIMSLTKFMILWFPIVMFKKTNEMTIYNRAVSKAFAVYSITPLVTMLNWIFYNGQDADLTVLAHPFPFIAILLFSRVTFLKLVDKATLKEELIDTRKKYVREKEVNKMKDEFVSTVSHELRTPLTSIRLYLSLLLQGKLGKITAKQKETLETLNAESARLNTLISDILTQSRYEQKKESINPKHTHLHTLVQSCIYPHFTEEKKLAIINNVPKDINLHIDQDKFKQVIINLLTNAVKHTDNGTITFSAEKSSKHIHFSIADTGTGIPADHLPYIFDKFYQAEGHMERTTGGLGLGLSIVKHIVDLHQGNIYINSELSKGTTFTIMLPEEQKSVAN